MSEFRSSGRIEEISAITRAVENVLRILLRFLVGRVSLVKLQEMIRFIFIEEIETKLRIDHPTRNVPLTQLALLSGLDTRTLIKIRNNPKYRRPFYEEASFLKEFAPGASILDDWSSKQEYINESTGEPLPLEISGDKPSFESLFRESTKSRGITYKSLLNRLIESGAVSIEDDDGKVYLVAKSYLPVDSSDKLGAIEMGFSALSNMTETITKNINASETNGKRLFQRGAWTYRLDPSNQTSLRAELTVLLEKTDYKARSIIEKYEEEYSTAEQITAGVSYFCFEEQETA